MVMYQILCCSVMWALLGLFTRYRSSLRSVMGSSNKDSEWSFGQVLALTTWVPVAVDLTTIYLCKFRIEADVQRRVLTTH